MFDQFTDEQLEQEMARRQRIKEEEKKPKQIERPDLTRLRQSCQTYIDTLADKGYPPKDGDHYIFETAMNTIYGDRVWSWVNERL
jgi:hypothetical protein